MPKIHIKLQIKIMAILSLILAVQASDSDIDESNYCSQQIECFLETLPPDVRPPLEDVLQECQPNLPWQGSDFISWVVNYAPYVDSHAWPCIIEEFNNYKALNDSFFSVKHRLLQALCSRSQHHERQELCQLMSSFERYANDLFELLPLASNQLIKEWLPFLNGQHTIYAKMQYITQHESNNNLKLLIEGKLSQAEAWRICMETQWGVTLTWQQWIPIIYIDEDEDQARSRAASAPSRLQGTPAKGP